MGDQVGAPGGVVNKELHGVEAVVKSKRWKRVC